MADLMMSSTIKSGVLANRTAEAQTSELLCFHCQSPVPARCDISVPVDGQNRALCCTSCLAAVQFIHELDLDAYYQYRDQCGVNASAEMNASAPDNARLQKAVLQLADGRQQLSLLIPDLRCVACVWLLEQVLGKQTGVSDININYATRRLRVIFDERQSAVSLAQRIQSLGYTVRADLPDAARSDFTESRRSLLIRLGVAGIGMMQVMMFALASYLSNGSMEAEYEALMRWASLALTTPVVFYSAWPFHRAAWYAVRHRSLIMDVPVSIAILAAWLLSVINTITNGHEVYFDTASMFTFFLLTGRYAELLSRYHFQQSQDLLEHLLPDNATRIDQTADAPVYSLIPLQDLRTGDLLRVLPGETIPADAYVQSGRSGVSEAAFTGEPLPQLKEAGARVLAGSINHDGELIIRVKCPADEFVIRQIARLQDRAGTYRPRWAQLADRTAQWFVALVLLIAGAAAAYWYQAGNPEFVIIALTVLVVSCPCALSLATPVAYSVACTSLRNAGIVIKNGAFLERAASTGTVIFDKTGTLTEACLTVSRIVALDSTEAECFELASALESVSHHPAALAFNAPHQLTLLNSRVVPGCGVQGDIDGHHYRIGLPEFALNVNQADLPAPDSGHWILLTRNQKALAWFCLQDKVRDDAAQTVSALNAQGINTAVLTGDRSMSAADIRQKFGVSVVRTGMSPEDKLDALRQMQSSAIVMMVGDGINDVAAMAAADTSLAVTPRDSFVQNSADAMLLNSTLMTLPRVLRFARKCRRVIRQNVAWSVAYNFTVIPFALMGMVPPWLAALGMSLSSVIVVSNAGRLRRMER
ncbi:MAG: heavy metal translocating P-type ATPase [Pseudohongiella sp.]|nr:heavy metal translocating P-type ATPase [Pseudohongiella sp.]MDP2128684.1 heavy metal translocating P-type ATPase [Pseudohongiella sp.]